MAEAGGQYGRLQTQILGAALLLLAYTKQLEFISVYSLVKLLVLGIIN
jgi:hypothetical protein